MKLRIGMRLRSTACTTEVVVVRAPAGTELDLTCGGAPMLDLSAAAPAPGSVAPGHNGGTQVGKRYARPELGVELLCTKPGTGSMWLDGAPLEPLAAKPLPASD
jgi:hypothetical protein